MDEGFKMINRLIGINAQQRLPFYEMLPWFLLSIGIFVGFWVVLMVLRKYALDKRKDKDISTKSAIRQIEKFHKDGILSDEQYKRAIRAVLGKNELISRGEEGNVSENENDQDDNS
ncbi:hypothetical protein DRQ00_10960 [candidate division KSB1 bacterium]|nr:MAG: hypothetical protein DRQ00_10960 [candidate division KSB1 bacterium]